MPAKKAGKSREKDAEEPDVRTADYKKSKKGQFSGPYNILIFFSKLIVIYIKS